VCVCNQTQLLSRWDTPEVQEQLAEAERAQEMERVRAVRVCFCSIVPLLH
jgi:hypothetical protein